MITEFIIKAWAAMMNPLFSRLPDIDLSGVLQSSSTLVDIISTGAYFLPIGTISIIIHVVIALQVIKITVAFLRLIADILPFF